MKWALIVWVLWQPGVPVKSIEAYFPTEQSCLDAMELIVDRYEEHDNYGYVLQCSPL